MPQPRVIPKFISGMTISQRIKHVRLMREMSQDQLANMAGMDQAKISSIETGDINHTNLKIDTLNRIAVALGCRLKIELILGPNPKRVDYRRQYRVLRDAQRPVPKTLEGARIRAESLERSRKIEAARLKSLERRTDFGEPF